MFKYTHHFVLILNCLFLLILVINEQCHIYIGCTKNPSPLSIYYINHIKCSNLNLNFSINTSLFIWCMTFEHCIVTSYLKKLIKIVKQNHILIGLWELIFGIPYISLSYVYPQSYHTLINQIYSTKMFPICLY